jgi:glycerol-3-phosphate acyltransferase PlsX
MGGDRGPEANLEGALLAVADQSNLRIKLVGRQNELEKALGKSFLPEEIEIVHAEDAFGMDEQATLALRRPNCSIMRAVDLLLDKSADGFVSMGNTGGVVATSLVRLGKIEGVERPALMTLFPTLEGLPTMVLDIGANSDCRPEHLLSFAEMGYLYATEVLDRKRPTIGLLSIGEEPSKGSSLVKASHELLRNSELNFVGNVEGSDLFHGAVDIVVTDGFTGNIILKFAEGSIGLFKRIAKKGRRKNLFSLAGGVLMSGGFKKVMKEFDYAEYGGAPLLGVDGNVIIGHGKSTPLAISNAISLAYVMVSAKIDSKIASYMKLKGRDIENENIRNRIEPSGKGSDQR